MARRKAYRSLDAFLNGRLVGTLNRQATGAIDFRYARDWLEWENTFPISLSLPLREDRYVGAPVSNVFDNLLPDNESIRRRVAEHVGASGVDAFSLLAALGRDCVGALQFLPEGTAIAATGAIEATPVSDDGIARLIANLSAAPLGIGDDDDFRISIAGAQEKTALLRHDGGWFKPIAMTATTHILKPQIGRLPNGVDLSNSVENEYFCLKLMEALGVPAAKAEIADFGQHRTLIVERFDRIWTKDGRLLRRPQEDCCQALSVPPTRKYQADGGPGISDIIDLLKGSDVPEADIMTFFRANLAFWLMGATDGHAKNFSVFITPGGRFRMTPVYDVLSAQPSLDAGRIQRKQFKLAMSVGASRHYRVLDIVPRHFLQTAERAEISLDAVCGVIEELAGTAEARAFSLIDELAQPLPDELVDPILSAIASRSRLLATLAG